MSAATTDLISAHREELEGSGIDPQVASERGYQTLGHWRSMTDSDKSGAHAGRVIGVDLKRFGFSKRQANPDDSAPWPALFVPVYPASLGGAVGSGQLKRRLPLRRANGSAPKYESPSRAGATVDVHPRWFAGDYPAIKDTSRPMWITEGVKKADALTSRGQVAVALNGVWGWTGRTGRGTREPSPDWRYIELRDREVYICFDSDVRTNISSIRAMRQLGLELQKRGAKVRYALPPAEKNGTATKGVDDFFVAGGTVEEIVAGATNRPPDAKLADGRFVDAHLAEMLHADVLDGQYLWLDSGQWIRWTGSVWLEVADVVVIEEARQWVSARIIEVIQEVGLGRALQDEVNSWMGVGSAGRLNHLVKLCRGMLLSELADFDQDDYLLNCPNGVLDLRTGELLEHDSRRLMMQCTSVEYDPGATDDRWDKALESIPAEVRDWAHMRFGQGIIGGAPPDDLLIMLWGPHGSNGKSTLKAGMLSALGGYAATGSSRLIATRSDNIPVELMTLVGRRIVFVDELPQDRRLNAERLRLVTERSEISIRRMYTDNELRIRPTHTLLVASNFRPIVAETDNATWRRLAVIPFPYRYVPDEEWRDDRPDYRRIDYRVSAGCERDTRVARAALAWLVRGAALWLEALAASPDGKVRTPDGVREAVREWRGETDTLAQFLSERVVFEGKDSGYAVSSNVLATAFRDYQIARGEQPWSDKLFTQRLLTEEAYVDSNCPRKVGRPLKRWHVSDANGGLTGGHLHGTGTYFVGVRMTTLSDRNPIDEE